MKFLLDHDVPTELFHLLQYWGYETILLRKVLPINTPDEKVFAYVRKQKLIIITCNRNHFLALAGKTIDQPGLIILIRRRTRQTECSRLRTLLNRAGEQAIRNNINFA